MQIANTFCSKQIVRISFGEIRNENTLEYHWKKKLQNVSSLQDLFIRKLFGGHGSRSPTSYSRPDSHRLWNVQNENNVRRKHEPHKGSFIYYGVPVSKRVFQIQKKSTGSITCSHPQSIHKPYFKIILKPNRFRHMLRKILQRPQPHISSYYMLTFNNITCRMYDPVITTLFLLTPPKTQIIHS